MPIATPRRNLATSKPVQTLYAGQTTIPHLPVPTLDSTFNKYLETLSPLQSKEEHETSAKLVKNFLSSPLSEKLQTRLQERAEKKDSWLSEWWNDAAYMGYRGRIIPNVNYFYTHKQGLGKGAGQEDRAAELVRGVVEFKKLVDR